MSSVLKPWVQAAPWKCQSILLSGLRGPDIRHSPKVKDELFHFQPEGDVEFVFRHRDRVEHA